MSADAGFEVVVDTDGGIAPEELARHGVAGARTCASWPRSNVRRSAGSMACSGGGPSGVLEGLRSCRPPRSGGRRVGPDLCRSVRVVADTTCMRLIARGRRAPEYAARERSSGPSTTPTAASPSPWRADLTCTTSHRAGRFSPDDVRRIWAVTEDPSSTTSAVPIMAPAVAHFDSAELAALRDP
jgi:hypothetical protein